MNKGQYDKGIQQARQGIYKGSLKDVAHGLLRALIAKGEPDTIPPPRKLKTARRSITQKAGK